MCFVLKIELADQLSFCKMSDTESDSSIHTPPKNHLTVERLIALLQKLVAEKPEAKSARVYRVEYGSLEKVREIELSDVMNGRKVKPFLVID